MTNIRQLGSYTIIEKDGVKIELTEGESYRLLLAHPQLYDLLEEERSKAYNEGLDDSDSYDEGYNEGYDYGYASGLENGRLNFIVKLKRFLDE